MKNKTNTTQEHQMISQYSEYQLVEGDGCADEQICQVFFRGQFEYRNG